MRSQKIVIGLDFSPASITAAAWVAEHFAPDAECLLAHVVDLPHAPRFLRGSAPPTVDVEIAARDFAESRMHDVKSFITPGWTTCTVRVGRPWDELATIAREFGADLLVIGPHGERPRPWKPLGTTAERLVRVARTSVLVASHPPASAPKRIVVAVDDAQITAGVLSRAKQLSDQFEADVTLLHVLDAPVKGHILAAASAAAHGEPDRLAHVASAMFEETTVWLNAIAEAGWGNKRVEVIVSSGDAGTAILDVASELSADLIVMGRSGRGAALPALLGSTVNTVLHGAPCPVLVVVETLDTL